MALDNIRKFAEEVEAETKTADPAMREKYAKLGEEVKSPTLIFQSGKALDANLADPAFKSQLKELAIRNPDGLRAAIPKIAADDKAMKTIVAAEYAKLPRPAAPAPAPATVKAESVKPDPAASPTPVAAVAAAGVSATPALRPRAAAQPPAQAANAPETGAAPATQKSQATNGPPLGDNVDMEKKVDYIMSRPGYDDFMEKVKSNQVPAVTTAFNALLAGKPGGAGTDKKAIDDVMKKMHEDPEFFRNLNKTMDEKPGVASKIVSSFSDPKTGMGVLSMYSNFTNSSIGQMIGGLLDKLFGPGSMDKMVNGLLGMAGGLFKNSNNGNPAIIQSNNGGSLARAALAATGATPSQVNLIDTSGTSRPMTGTQLAALAQEQANANQQRQVPAASTPQAGV